MQEYILKQKSIIKWAEEGDSNSKYFHSVIKEKRRRAHIYRIKDNQGIWIEGNEAIAKAAIDHFSNIFAHKHSDNNLSILGCIDLIVTEKDNHFLNQIPDEEELKNTVFSIDPNSSAGPDGFNGHFYQASWDIIKREVCKFVQKIFNGYILSRFYTHTNLVLIPKISSPSSLSQLRPISLCNVSNKIISKIISIRIANILPKLISDNQFGFLKGRLITENILLAQELVHGIKKINQGGNIVIKLDMSKAHDKLSWSFLTAVLRKMNFSEIIIDSIHRLISVNWYSILINGTRHLQVNKRTETGRPSFPFSIYSSG